MSEVTVSAFLERAPAVGVTRGAIDAPRKSTQCPANRIWCSADKIAYAIATVRRFIGRLAVRDRAELGTERPIISFVEISMFCEQWKAVTISRR